MSKNRTHITIVLDKSGSMSGSEDAVLQSINGFINEQAEVDGKCTLDILQFNQEAKYTYIGKLKKYKGLTRGDYVCSGFTSLNDAIGLAMKDILVLKADRKVVIVQTDGYENSSKEYTKDTVTKMIKDNEKKVEVIFIGAGIDTQQGKDRGMVDTKLMSVDKSIKGMTNAYATISASVSMYRGTGSAVDVSGDTGE